MDYSNKFVIIFFVGVALVFVVKQALNAHQFFYRKKYGKIIPAQLQNSISSEDIAKTCAYKNEYYKFGIFKSIVSTVLSVALFCTGFYVALFSSLWDATKNIYTTTLLFSILSSIPHLVVDLPFDIFSEFSIEKRFGFSTMTKSLFVLDMIKSLVIEIVFSALLLVVMTFVFEHTTSWWWVLSTVYVVFSLLVTFLYPRVIAPLFNKFTPLEEGELKSKVSDFMARTGFTASKIFVMDASKRSKHSNAYFTGFGKSKRVVLYDTLINQLTVDEVGAVLAHELGHFKKKHIIKQLCVTLPMIYVVLFLMSRFINYEPLYKGFGFATTTDAFSHMKFIGLFLLSSVFGNFTIFVSGIANYFSRKNEYEADAFAKELCGTGVHLSSALVKLNKENNSEIQIAPLYSAFFYSHPTLIERMNALEK